MLNQCDADSIMFADENEQVEITENISKKEPWKIVIVDDDPVIHEVTKMALNGFEFDGRELEFIQCYSGSEAMETIRLHKDAAVMLLDVVMESDTAGLDVAEFVRKDAKNLNVRIILRTGQPGQAPERRVITEYDINDYKEKTELTSGKLFTLMCASLRSYRDIITIEKSKLGLERVIDASADIFELGSLRKFTTGVLDQLMSLFHIETDAIYVQAGGLAAEIEGDQLKFIAGTGQYADFDGESADELVDGAVMKDLQSAMAKRQNIYCDDRFVGYFESAGGARYLLYIDRTGALSDIDRGLVDLFTRNISIAFENVNLHADLEETQREIVYMLGEAVETRSRETGNHVKRVAEISKLLALEYGLSEAESEIIRLASPLHDVGKIGTPDAIQNKPGKLDAAEWEVMQGHVTAGYDMLKSSRRRILQAGAVIAYEHHEKWDGTGYPQRKSGTDIHIYGRITALADVFDALSSDRCYKKAWPLDETLALIEDEKGKHFDPKLVDLLFNNMDRIVAIRDSFQDTYLDAA